MFIHHVWKESPVWTVCNSQDVSDHKRVFRMETSREREEREVGVWAVRATVTYVITESNLSQDV